MTDEAGEVVVNYTYRAFGEQLKRLDKSNNPTEDVGKYSYSGKELDEDINLYYFNARFYDATTGRFINVDPIQDGQNWYVYCNNNPLARVDPTGLKDENGYFNAIKQSLKNFFRGEDSPGTTAAQQTVPGYDLSFQSEGIKIQKVIERTALDLLPGSSEYRTLASGIRDIMDIKSGTDDASKENITVQIGAFENKDNASGLLFDAVDKGLNVSAFKDDTSGLYKVQANIEQQNLENDARTIFSSTEDGGLGVTDAFIPTETHEE